jgi:tetrahydromethanopterin S-methyltransferase subunit G
MDHYYISNFRTEKEKVVINYLFLPTELSKMIQSICNIQDLTQLDLKLLFLNRFDNNQIDEVNFIHRIQFVWFEVNGYEIDDNSDLDEIRKKVGNVKTHSFRKFFRTMVKRANIDSEFMEHITGHTLVNLAGAYNRDLQNIEWYYNEWLKVEPFLSIDSEIVDKTSEKVKDLEKENQNLKERLDKIEKALAVILNSEATMFYSEELQDLVKK